MNIFERNEFDTEFLSLLEEFTNKRKNNLESEAFQYFKKFNFAYIGELAERFLDCNLIDNSKKMLSLINLLSSSNYRRDLFQQNQKYAFINNVYKWIDRNNVSNEEIKIIKIHLTKYFFTNFTVDDTEAILKFKTLLDDLNSDSFKIDFYDSYNVHAIINNNVTPLYLKFRSEIDRIILKGLDYSKIDLSVYSLKDLLTLIESLNCHPAFNILSSLEIKASCFKNHKENFHLLRSLKQISFTELDLKKVEKIEKIINRNACEVFYLNYKLSESNVSYNGSKRILDLLLKTFFSYTGDVNDEILNFVANEMNIYNLSCSFEKNYDKISNQKILEFFYKKISFKNLTCLFAKKLLLDKTNLELIPKDKVSSFALSVLSRFTFDDKESFDNIYKLINIEELKQDELNDVFYNNLFKFKVLDILDIQSLNEKNILSKAIDYISDFEGNIAKHIYIANFPDEIIKNNNITLKINNLLDLLDKDFDYKHVCLLFNLTTKNYLSKEEYKDIIYRETINTMLKLTSIISPYKLPDLLFNFINDNKTVKYLDFSDEEIFELKKELYNSNLLSNENCILLKPLFLSKEEILKEKEEEFLYILHNKEEFKNLDFYGHSLTTFFSKNINLLIESNLLQKEIFSFFKTKVTPKILNSNWSSFTKFYFLVANSNFSNDFKENLFKQINNAYLSL